MKCGLTVGCVQVKVLRPQQWDGLTLGEWYKLAYGKRGPNGTRGTMPARTPATAMYMHMRMLVPEDVNSIDAVISAGRLSVVVNMERLRRLFTGNRNVAQKLCSGNVDNRVPHAWSDQVTDWDQLFAGAVAALQRAKELGVYVRSRKVSQLSSRL